MSMSTRSRKRSPLALVDEEEDNDVQVVERKETSYDRHKKPNELEYKNLPSFRKKCSAKQSKKPSLDVSGGDSVKEPDNNSQWNGPLSGRVSQPKQTSKSNLKFVPRLGPLSLPPCTATLTAAQPLKSGKRGQSNEAPVVIEHSEDEEEKKKNEEMEKRKQDILSPDSNCLLGIKAAGREYLYSTCENQCSSTEHISRNLLGVVDSSPVASPSCTYTSEAHKRDVSPPASLLSHSPSPSVVTKSPYFSQSTQGTSTHTVGLFGADRDSDDDFEHPRQYGSLPGSSHSSTLIEGLDYSNPSLTFLPRRPLHSKPDNFYGSSNGTSSGAPWLSSRRRSCTYMYEKKSKNPKLISKSGNPSKPPYATSATLDSIFTRTMRKPATRGHSTADLVVCISEDEEEKEEKVEEEKSTRRKKPNLKKEREEEAEELYKPSSSQTQSTRATKYVTRSSTTNPRLSTQRELNEEVALDVDIVRFGTLETTAIGDAQAMKSRGLHFFPQEDAEKYASLSDKDREVEREVYDHISMCCSAYAFQLSHWNNESARDQVVVRVCPCSTPEQRKQLQDQTDLELLPWPVILGGKRSCKLSVTEDSEAFSTNPEEGAEAHSSLFFTLEAMSSGHMTTTSPVHANTVTQWLLATRPLAAS